MIIVIIIIITTTYVGAFKIVNALTATGVEIIAKTKCFSLGLFQRFRQTIL